MENSDLTTIESPYEPRKQFMPLHLRDTRWGIVVAHRRAGKTVACVNDLIKEAACCIKPNPRFAYIAPQLNQAKDIVWQYLLEYTECFGPERKVNASELWVELPNNNARIRIYGADNPDRLRGIYLDGVVLDEFGDMNPTVWTQVIRPALSDRKGWAIFIGTPKGKNVFYDLWQNAENDDDWSRLMLKASETGLLDDRELNDARRMMSEDEFNQEYECSFEAAIRGAFYGKEFMEADASGRLTHVPHDPALPVHTAWDLGMSDSTVIWFVQTHGGETRWIDCIKGEGVGLDWYVKQLQERPYVWGNHYLPHDVRVRELGTGRSRLEVLQELGLRNIEIAPRMDVNDGIQALRMLLPRSWFDKDKCKTGIEALRMYRRDYNEKRQEFYTHPLHDWCFTGDTQILTRNGMYQISNLPKNGEVLTRCGWKQYENPRVTRRNANLVEVRFTDGLSVRCTPDHMFMTDSGWKYAENLEPGSKIQSSLTLSRSISMAASIAFTQAIDIMLKAANGFTGLFGKMPLAQYQMNATSITGTQILQTMPLRTLNASSQTITAKYREVTDSKNAVESSSPRRLGKLLLTGIDQKRVGSGINDRPSAARTGLSGSESHGTVRTAVKSFRRLFERMGFSSKSSAMRTAKPLTIANVRYLSETEDVWCITVPGVEEFSLSNGAVVHNCSHYADAARYFAIAHREQMGYTPIKRNIRGIV